MQRYINDSKTGLRVNVADREMSERLYLATFTCAIGGIAFFYIRDGLRFGFDYTSLLIAAFLLIDFARFGILSFEKRYSAVGDPRFSRVIAGMSLCLAGLVGELANSNLQSTKEMNFIDATTILTLAAYAALSTMTFVSKRRIAISHISLILGIPILGCFKSQVNEDHLLGVLLSIYLAALILHVRLLHQQFVDIQILGDRAREAAVAKASNDQLNQFFQETPFPAHIMSADGTLRMVNRAWGELWGLTEGQIQGYLGRLNLLSGQGTDQHNSIANLQRVLGGERVQTEAVEVDPVRIGGVGRSRWVERYYNPIVDSRGQVNAVLVMYRDVTERREALLREQMAVEASKMKTEFLANMSHEIRTPINGVLGMIGFLRDSVLTDEQKDFADAAHRSAQGLLTVINDILDLSKVEAGKLELEANDFSLSEIIQDVSHAFSILSEQKHLRYNVHFDERMKGTLHGDANRIRQILNNLVSNAVKFTEHGSIDVSVTLIEDLGERVRFRIGVRDSGLGIPLDMQARLFKAFEQANTSTSRRYGGTGLGLAISKNLTTLMNGTIDFESREGTGSNFWVELELARGQAAIARTERVFNGDMSVFSRASILIAEDNKINQVITLRVLQSLGLRCEIAENGHEVLDRLRSSSFDLILMDCQMPGMDGFEATEKIRASGNLIPIVGFTAGAMQADRDRCLTSGMNDYLSKPADKNALIKKLGPIVESALKRVG